MFLSWLFVQLSSSNHLSAANPWKLKEIDNCPYPTQNTFSSTLEQKALVIHNLHSNKNTSSSSEQQALINPTQNMTQEEVMVNPVTYLSKKTSSSSVNQAPVKPFPLNFADSGPSQTKIQPEILSLQLCEQKDGINSTENIIPMNMEQHVLDYFPSPYLSKNTFST